MKRIVTWCLSTLTVLVLLFGYHTSTSGPSTSSETAIVSGSGSSSSSSGSTTSSSSSSSSGNTYTGSSADTRWGPVQVEITVKSGKVTDVSVVDYPDGNPKDQEINASALPILIDETVTAQTADIDMVSGATVTSVGYQQSLQSALDEAGL